MNSLGARAIAIFIIYSLIGMPYGFSQLRPRRVEEVPTVSNQTLPVLTSLPSSNEIVVRVGLSTNAYAVNISTNDSRLIDVSNESSPVPLNVARVRVESRLLAPQPSIQEANSFHVELAQLENREQADRAAQEIETLTGNRPDILQTGGTWLVRTKSAMSRDDAEDLRGQLENVGLESVAVVEAVRKDSSLGSQVAKASPTPLTNSGILRPVYRSSVPTRELIVYSTSPTPLLNARAPVVFASNDQSKPIQFNSKSYRGKLEVFANSRGSLTVVNVINLEDYVRGVVPNELSPGGFPAIEALKAQAVAARTYAVSNRGRFASDGFDVLPTTRSQVYGGLSTEHPLTDRAVEETRGIVATYNGEPINALYTSTCGGRTEHVENIFTEHTPYLRGRECSTGTMESLLSFNIKTSREPSKIETTEYVSIVNDYSVLSVHGFNLPARVTDDWFSSPVSMDELRNWISSVSVLSRRPAPSITNESVRPGEFCSLLGKALDGESRGDVLLSTADVEYLLSFRDAHEIPARNRADVAMFLRDGYLMLHPDATLRPNQPITRARAIYALARTLESRNLLSLQKATARPSTNNLLVVRSNKGDRTLNVKSDAFLFRAFGEHLYQMREVALVGGEQVVYHTDSRGQVDYLETHLAENGAASDRFSPFSYWTKTQSAGELVGRLYKVMRNVGELIDLRVASRGSSRRATDLEVIGTRGTAHIYGGRIRSILGLKEQLFVIDRNFSETGKPISFTFTGRGWGHGVGMCQVGAFGLAKSGWTYDKILKAYYTDISLTKLY